MKDSTVGLIACQRESPRSRASARRYAKPTAMFWNTLVAASCGKRGSVAKRSALSPVRISRRSCSRSPSSISA
jgi:hypothetical protein